MTPAYEDSTVDTERRVSDLLDRMTVEEKVGQLLVHPSSTDVDTIREQVSEMIRDGHLGQISPIGRSEAPDDPGEAVAMINELQRVAVEETRLGIPLLVISNAVHGHAYMQGCTAFPHNLGIAASRNEALVEATTRATAAEMVATGVHQNYGPILDVCRDPRWGRTFETFGESTYLCGELGAAQVRGLQDGDPSVIATVKHFPAYGEPQQGEDAGVNELSESTFRRMHLASQEKALDAGADSVMPCYNSINGQPVHGSAAYVDDLLRSERGFEGFVVSDHHGTRMLVEDHRTAESKRDAIRQSVEAGIDAFLDFDVVDLYGDDLVALVESGAVSERRLDESVRRVLRAKFERGLFEEPYADESLVDAHIGTDDHRELALDAARESTVLLENEDDLLPFGDDVDDVLVTGPVADEVDFLLGGWSRVDSQNGVSVREGLERVAPDGTSIRHEPGASLRAREDVDAARSAAAEADVAVVALGDGAYIHEFGHKRYSPETGAFPTRSELSMPAAQQALLEAVHETDTPTVAVYVAGRPPTIPWAAEHVPAILASFYPGDQGGLALAEVLFGEHNPSGTLPVSVPRSAAELPQRFNHLKHPEPIGSDQHADTYDPLYPFGHGHSYTDFEIEDVELSATTVDADGEVTVAVTVANVGERAGRKNLDVFVRDDRSSRVTPVRELRAFDGVTLEPGERETVALSVDVSEMAVLQSDGTRRVEPGTFEVFVGEHTRTFAVE